MGQGVWIDSEKLDRNDSVAEVLKMCIRDSCIAYCGILSRHTLCATGTTGKLVADATGLNIHRFLSGEQGGDQQIAARIACNEIDLLLFFRDSMQAQQPEPPYDKNLLRLCDVHNIPVATNIATAEVLIHGLERGDLDWREIVKL